MAAAWIKVEHPTPDKPEIDAIANKLGIDVDAAFGKVIRFWIWADQQTASGNKFSVTKALLDRVTYCQGFTDALVSVGWLNENRGAFSIPNFDRHNGQSAKSRAETSRRVSDHRGKVLASKATPRAPIPRPIRAKIIERDLGKCVYCGRLEGQYQPTETKADSILSLDHVIPLTQGGSDDESNLVSCCIVCNRYKGNRTPDECGLTWPVDQNGKRFGNKKSLPELEREIESFPSEKSAWFSSPEFSAAWKAWAKQRKKKPGERQYRELEKLSDGKLETAIEILNKSATNQWTGIFPLKGEKNGTHRPNRTDRLDADATALKHLLEGSGGSPENGRNASAPNRTLAA